MKRRFSVKKAEWSEIRERDYQKYCDNILYRNKLQLRIDGDKVYLLLPDKEALLVKIDNGNKMWYEIWLKLKVINFK